MLADIPRRVWFHWMQGMAEMPPVVRECLKSWTNRNPDWEVVFIDGNDVWNYLDRNTIPVDKLLKTSPQVYANAIRLSLLSIHGGVWVDATTWCQRPLSEWLTEMPGDFFAFSSPGPDRMIANWFIASHSGSYLTRKMANEYVEIFKRLGPLTIFPDSTVCEILNRAESTDVFFEPLLIDTLRGYPYFLFHYLFAFIYRRDDQFKRAWDSAGKISADSCHLAQSMNLLASADDVARQGLRAANPPLHKLSWRVEWIEPGSLLDEILTGSV